MLVTGFGVRTSVRAMKWTPDAAEVARAAAVKGLAMERLLNMPPGFACGLAVWRPAAERDAEVMGKGLPFLRSKAQQQHGLIK